MYVRAASAARTEHIVDNMMVIWERHESNVTVHIPYMNTIGTSLTAFVHTYGICNKCRCACLHAAAA